jgi:CheY-like chemotaxis protein
MEHKRPKALLIGENPQGSSYLAKRLQTRGCECEFAVSPQDVYSLLRAQGFDLVLSPIRLRYDSLFGLIALLDSSGVTLFFSHAVEDGCWWLPALRHGQKCFGSSALRPSEFVVELDEAIQEIYLRAATQRKDRQSAVPELLGSVAALPSSSREFQPAEPKRVEGPKLLARKRAG